MEKTYYKLSECIATGETLQHLVSSKISASYVTTAMINEVCGRVNEIFDQRNIYFYIKYEDSTDDEMAIRLDLLVERIAESSTKWAKLVELQNTDIANLTAQLSQTRETRYNDTPQSFGSYSADSYTSNVTKETTTTPLGNVADKLAIAEAALLDYYDRWADEARSFMVIVL